MTACNHVPCTSIPYTVFIWIIHVLLFFIMKNVKLLCMNEICEKCYIILKFIRSFVWFMLFFWQWTLDPKKILQYTLNEFWRCWCNCLRITLRNYVVVFAHVKLLWVVAGLLLSDCKRSWWLLGRSGYLPIFPISLIWWDFFYPLWLSAHSVTLIAHNGTIARPIPWFAHPPNIRHSPFLNRTIVCRTAEKNDFKMKICVSCVI